MSKILFIQQAPQNCTWTTKNLLHFDMYSQKMYKCNGYMWTVWDSDDPADSPRGLAPAPSLCLIGNLKCFRVSMITFIFFIFLTHAHIIAETV